MYATDIQAWAYSAALFCCHCAEQAYGKEALSNGTARDGEGNTPSPVFVDSSEADSPQHCDSCGEFLENALTDDGVEFVADSIAACLYDAMGNRAIVQQWASFYDSPKLQEHIGREVIQRFTDGIKPELLPAGTMDMWQTGSIENNGLKYRIQILRFKSLYLNAVFQSFPNLSLIHI